MARKLRQQAVRGRMPKQQQEQVVAAYVQGSGKQLAGSYVRRDNVNGKVVTVMKPQMRTWSLYVGSDDAYTAMRVVLAAQGLLIAMGATRVELLSVQRGSILIKAKAWAKKWSQMREVRILGSEVMLAAEAATVEKMMADNNSKNVTAIASLAEAVKDVDSVAFDGGSLQFAQYTDENGKKHIRARALTAREVAANRVSDQMLQMPEQLFRQIEADPNRVDIDAPSDEDESP